MYLEENTPMLTVSPPEKQIRETPHKRHHKFVEFYDVRAAEAALKALNRCEIAGKRIKVEPSRPGGTRRRFVSFFDSPHSMVINSVMFLSHI